MGEERPRAPLLPFPPLLSVIDQGVVSPGWHVSTPRMSIPHRVLRRAFRRTLFCRAFFSLWTVTGFRHGESSARWGSGRAHKRVVSPARHERQPSRTGLALQQSDRGRKRATDGGARDRGRKRTTEGRSGQGLGWPTCTDRGRPAPTDRRAPRTERDPHRQSGRGGGSRGKRRRAGE